jgi:glycosyltransferase involved in cell wall biosynthesis
VTHCEIRTPSFRRPKLLRRALESVRLQTFGDWRCIVFDDCPDGSARPVVEAMGDARFEYRQNRKPLGAIGNIDQCFRREPFAGGRYACVVEDDNFLLPDHLEAQLETCRREHVRVTFSAQYVEAIERPGQSGILTQDKTIAWIYPEGRRAWRDMLPAVLFSHAFSNGAVFWSVGCRSDFVIGAVTRHPGIQETLRMLRLRDDVYVSHRATSVWRSNDPRDSYVSGVLQKSGLSAIKARWRRLSERREVNDYRRWYLRRFGEADARDFAVEVAPNIAAAMERSMLLAGQRVAFSGQSATRRWSLLAKGYAFRAVVLQQLDLRRFDVDQGLR